MRYLFFARTLGVPTLTDALWTLVGVLVWCVLPVAAGRWCGRHGWRRAQHALERWWARGVTRHLGIRLDIAGVELIEPGVPYVVAPLHEGFTDALALLHLPLDLRFAVRDELYDWRLLGAYLRDTGQIAVCPERGLSSYRRLLRGAPGVFSAGESLVVFPQGTILGIETELTGGVFALARALQRPILPVALTGSHRVWEYPFTPRLRYRQRISLRVLPPIPADSWSTCAVDDVRRRVQRALKAAALSGAMAPPRRFLPARDGYWDGYAFRIDPAFADLVADVARRCKEHPRRKAE